MPETLTKKQRSRVMAAVKSQNTKPEMAVRKIVHRMGFRFRLHRRDLPGTPDIVLPRLRKVINVHGCFWHLHTCRHARRNPVNNADYWKRKRAANAMRDRRTKSQLERDGWSVLIVWECEIGEMKLLTDRVRAFLVSDSKCR